VEEASAINRCAPTADCAAAGAMPAGIEGVFNGLRGKPTLVRFGDIANTYENVESVVGSVKAPLFSVALAQAILTVYTPACLGEMDPQVVASRAEIPMPLAELSVTSTRSQDPKKSMEQHTLDPTSEGFGGKGLAGLSNAVQAFNSAGSSGNDQEIYPEGGLQAWSVVLGSWLALFSSFGLMNILGTFQAYLSTHQLANLDEGTIGWIFSLYTFLTFLLGLYIGPIFDKHGPRYLVLAGTISLLASLMFFSISTRKLCAGMKS
jgi:hypothetical protein